VVVGRTAVLPGRPGTHTGAVMNQTPVWPPPPPRRRFWDRLTPLQRAGLIAAGFILPCTGALALIGTLAGDPPSTVIETPAAEQLAGAATGTPATADPDTGPGGESATTEPAAGETSAAAEPVVTKKTVTVTKSIGFSTRTVKDPDLAKGRTEVRTKGVAGVRTLSYEVTLTDGKETKRTLLENVVTRKPVTKVVAVGTKAVGGGNCDPNYSGACVPIASDVDCAGGSGNGPAYVEGPVTVIGDDIYDLDRDGDGIACDT